MHGRVTRGARQVADRWPSYRPTVIPPSRRAAAVLSTMWDPGNDEWNAVVDVREATEQGLLLFILSFAWAARRYRAVVLLGSMGRADRYRDLFIGILIRRVVSPRTRIVLTDCTWSPGSVSLSGERAFAVGLTRGAHRSLVRALNGPRTVFCVLTEAERRLFPQHWSVPAERVVTTPFSHTVWEQDHLGPEQVEDPVPARGDYVFAGGDSMRDYDLLIEASRGLGAPVVVATNLPLDDVPDNVRVGPLSHEDFMDALTGAGAVAVPLRNDGHRSAGQQTYLNAMLYAKPVVVTDSMGVREIITDGEDGVVVPAEPDAVRAALQGCLAPAAAADMDRIGRAARRTVLSRHTPRHYRSRLLEIALDGSSGRRSPSTG